jgi:hypothetical protein
MKRKRVAPLKAIAALKEGKPRLAYRYIVIANEN